MADQNDIIENSDAQEEKKEKSFTQAELDNIVKKRLKNAHAKIADLEGQMATMAPADALTPRAAADINQDAVANGKAPVSTDDINQMMAKNLQDFEQKQIERQQQQALQQQQVQASKKLNEFMTGDPKFKKLVEKASSNEGAYDVPAAVATHVLTTYPSKAKEILSSLMTNELHNMRMKNAMLSSTPEDSSPYNKWLSSYFENQQTPANPNNKESIDLSDEVGPSTSSVDDMLWDRI